MLSAVFPLGQTHRDWRIDYQTNSVSLDTEFEYILAEVRFRELFFPNS